MKTEFLKELGLEQDAIDKIMAENGKDVNAVKNELATTQEELKQTKEQLTTANTTIDGFKDYDDIKAQVEDYKTKYQQAEEEKSQIKSDYAFSQKLKEAGTSAGVKSFKAVKPFLDMDALKASKNQDADIKSAFEKLKESDDTKFLFTSDEPHQNAVHTTRSNVGSSGLSPIAKAMGLTEEDLK